MCRSDFNSIWSHLPCCLSKGCLKLDFLEIYLTTCFGVPNFRNKLVMKVSFFQKCTAFNVDVKNAEKFGKIFLFLRYLFLNWRPKVVSIKKRILTTNSQLFNKQSSDIAYDYERVFWTQLPSQWSIKMLKMLLSRFQQCLVPFIMLLVEGPYERELFKYLSNHVFWSALFRKCIRNDGHFLFKNVQKLI